MDRQRAIVSYQQLTANQINHKVKQRIEENFIRFRPFFFSLKRVKITTNKDRIKDSSFDRGMR